MLPTEKNAYRPTFPINMKQRHLTIRQESVVLTLEKEVLVGRLGYGADVEINSKKISRKHAVFMLKKEGLFVKDLGSVNGTMLNGNLIEPHQWTKVNAEDLLLLADEPVGKKQPLPEENKQAASPENALESNSFKAQIKATGVLSIGRLTSNAIVLNDPTVSKVHAKISYADGLYWIEDQNSMNHTFLNGEILTRKTQLTDTDTVRISFFTLNLLEGTIDLKKQGSAIEAIGIEKVYPNQKIGLQAASFKIPHSSFVALMGPSGCGKSTLLKCLNGDNPATSGEVKIHGLSLQDNFNLIKKKIGYVPQDDIIHPELTVYKTLFYAAKLRLPDDSSIAEINTRINHVIQSLNLDQDQSKDIKQIRVGDLSGGQRKRISIAVELLTEPAILFLDEPTSPLDPETIDSFLSSIKQLAATGTTIIMVTHKPEDLNYVDQVFFLGVQGYLVYKGAATNLLTTFSAANIVEVYARMSTLEEVEKTYKKPVIPTYREEILNVIKPEKPDSLWLQLSWLIKRYLQIKRSDKENLILLLAQPIIIAALVCLVFSHFKVGVLFLMTISAVWFGVSNAAKEIVGEQSVYKRERMFNLNIHTYILSKWSVLSLIAFIQSLIFVSIVYANFKINPDATYPDVYLKSFWKSTFFMFYIAVSATLIGLWLSAFLNTTEKVMTVVPIALMPQIMLAGVMTKLNNVVVEGLSFFTLGRWGTEGFSRIQDHASTAVETSNGTVLNSVFSPFPSQQGGVIELPNSALKSLDLYNKTLMDNGTLIGSVFDGFDKNIGAISLLNIVLYILIYRALKKKDSL